MCLVSRVMCHTSRVQEEQPGGQEVPGHAADAGESAAAAGPLPGERQQGAEGADGGEGSGVGQAEVIHLFSRTTVYSLHIFNYYIFHAFISEKD